MLIRIVQRSAALALLLLAASCQTTKKAACAPDVMCTMIFKSVTVHVLDGSGRPMLLDDAYTINVNTGETIKLEGTSTAGYYTVLDDSYQKKLQNKTAQFQFIGKKNGVRIVEETYRISADCCHIDKQSGKDEIIVK